MKLDSYWLIGFVAILSGCATGIQITHVTSNTGTIEGNPWNLPMTQFVITITRQVVKCGATLEGASEVIATPGMVVDDLQRYTLTSNGWWATSDITSTLNPAGTSVGLNAQSADQTATVISNVVGTVGQGLIGAAVFAAAAHGVVVGADACTDEVGQAVLRLNPPDRSPKLKEIVDQDTSDLAASTARVALLTAQAGLVATYKKDLASALGEQSLIQQRLNVDQKNLAADLKKTTNTQVVSWPLSSATFVGDRPFSIDDEVLAHWLRNPTPAAVAAASKQFDAYPALYVRNGSSGTWEGPQPVTANDSKVGVPVRLARTGLLLVCTKPKASRCPATLPSSGSNDPDTFQFSQTILQLGQMYTVPVAGGTFRAQQAIVALDANGLPSSIEVIEKVAGAAALSAAAKDAASQVAALPGQISAAKLAQVQSQVNQQNAQASLATAEANAGIAGQTAPLAAQTGLVNAQIAYAAAQTNAGLPTNQTNSAAAQTALMNAQAALVTAQANASVITPTSALAAHTSLINAETAQVNAAAARAKAIAALP